jgi:hypothetical protein
MDDAKQQLVEKLKTSNNVLVTVSRNPSVDQLAACIGLTLLLNKQGKHTAAVFSGQVPSTIEFLQPEATLEKNTDSLRDFIISLDKAKADKLRYKVENDVVRIFITPYKTSITEKDFDFSQGDFNVDVVVALGVTSQEDLDEAITAHGRILHDATVASINTSPEGGLGSINWYDPQASSLSELVAELTQDLDPSLLDAQAATALLTGIVSETERFSNDKTSSITMSVSALLMGAGANQQLVASQLEEGESFDSAPANPTDDAENEDEDDPAPDGTIQIDHENDDANSDGDQDTEKVDEFEDGPAEDESADEADEAPAFELPGPEDTSLPSEQAGEDPAPATPETPETPTTPESDADTSPEPSPLNESHQNPKLMTEPPSLGGTLTANSGGEQLDPVTDPLSMPSTDPPQLLERKSDDRSVPADAPAPADPPGFTPPPPAWVPPADPPQPASDSNQPAASPSNTNLAALEAEVKDEDMDDARDEVNRALSGSTTSATTPPEAIEALNAQPLGNDLHTDQAAANPQPPSLAEQIPGLANPSDAARSNEQTNDAEAKVKDANAPPPVPPPIPFQFGKPPDSK